MTVSTPPAAGPLHPVLGCLATVEAALKDVADVSAVFMTAAEKAAALTGVERVLAGLSELQLRVLSVADDLAEADGSRDAAAWLSHHARLDGADARRRLDLARSLEERPTLRAALAQGAVSTAQAAIITRAVDDLPAVVEEDLRARAEAHLLEQAHTYGPKQLRQLARRLVDVVAPDLAEEQASRALEAEERAAAQATFLRFHPNGDGTTDIHARLADAVANRLRTYLEAYTNPRHTHPDTASEVSDDQHPDTDHTNHTDHTDEADEADEADERAQVDDPDSTSNPGPEAPEPRRSYPRRLGEAFGWLLEHLDPDRLPLHGGDATTLIVTIDDETLRGRVAGDGLIGEDPISAGEIRRMACTAGIIPAVLGGPSHILDLGRTRRLASPAQRRARAALDKTCRARGCTVPAAWCECHHKQPWSTGGRTDLRDLILLCAHHHRRAHDPTLTTTHHPDGTVTFHRRE